ncbi:hypothetical protein EB796_014212 [Bugula neritina]|uniref:Uncharacterized protein n=1 Tax=Bugula neritina TaxID=10212 RepID=A0A7J7JP80_BUGNE|nr:hypothetical protein EB796_014212 [Bugula neritina]
MTGRSYEEALSKAAIKFNVHPDVISLSQVCQRRQLLILFHFLPVIQMRMCWTLGLVPEYSLSQLWGSQITAPTCELTTRVLC